MIFTYMRRNIQICMQKKISDILSSCHFRNFLLDCMVTIQLTMSSEEECGVFLRNPFRCRAVSDDCVGSTILYSGVPTWLQIRSIIT